MIARDKPQFALRPFLPEDTPLLSEIFRASVEGLTEDDYTPAQQDAWMSEAEDLESLAKRLGKHLALIATMDPAHEPALLRAAIRQVVPAGDG